MINNGLENFLDAIRQMIRVTAPELVADIMQHGIVLTGGMARLQGLAERVSTEIGVPVQVALEPELKVVQGLTAVQGKLLNYLDLLLIQRIEGDVYDNSQIGNY